MLELIAATAGATRAAVLVDDVERRVVVGVQPGEAQSAGSGLAAWLDARAPRSRAERAASGPALVSVAMSGSEIDMDAIAGGDATDPIDLRGDAVTSTDDQPGLSATTLDSPRLGPLEDDAAGARTTADGWQPAVPGGFASDASESGHYACLNVPSSLTFVLGLQFAEAALAANPGERFSPALVRHAGAAIALVSEQGTVEHELETLRAQDRERTRFVSTVVHELRTPLTGLGGYLELVLSDSVADPTVEREFLERSRDIVSSMDELVGDLLEISRLESGSLRLELGAFSVAEIVQRVLDHLAPIALEREVHLSAQLPPRLRSATGDRRRVDQILKNLLGNALKFTPPGGHVELAAWFDGPVAVLAVRDDGMGIAPDDRVRIFERFFRMASHERVNGTGLGLPIARELAQAMRGDLDVASVQRAGSSFVVAIPGSTTVDPDTLAAVLDRTLQAETERLEEQGMLRRLQFLNREAPAGAQAAGGPRPSLGSRQRPSLDPDGKPRLERLEGHRLATNLRGAHSVTLRAIEGSGPRRDPVRPA
ncbi:MAG TPA: HAMP domain-containing sensor histidine kinase [Candidatus Saccharimonadales bacterium]|nr:HAMP domain-containing sensor histidine kinase [Candidatus Saccharimonadales bacterium]